MDHPITVGPHRFYNVHKLPVEELNETQKILNYNYTIKNLLQIPIRLERVLFNP
jgi:hypothetical protein